MDGVMQEIALFSLYLTMGVFIVAMEGWRIASRQPFNALSLFNGAYFILFVFAPLNVLAYGEVAVRQKYAYHMWLHGDMGTALALLFCYVLFVAGYLKNGERAAGFRFCAADKVNADAERMASFLVISFLCAGMASMAYHVSLVGGVTNSLFLAPLTRTGEHRLDGAFLFVRQFNYFCATAFMLLWAIYLDGRLERVVGRMTGHLAVGVLGLIFVFYALSTYGRREFLYPIIICFIVWFFARERRSFGKLTWLFLLSALWFWMHSFVIPVAAQPVAAQPVAAQPVADVVSEVYIKMVQGLNDSFMHFVASQSAELWQFGFLSDIWELPAQFLPSKLLGFDRGRGMFGETSAFILGRPLEAGLSGEEPLGMHGYLLVNFGYPGLFLLFFAAGAGYRALDSALRPAKGGPALAWLIFLWAIIGALEFLREGVLALVLKPRFSWWLAIGLILWFVRTRASKELASNRQQAVN